MLNKDKRFVYILEMVLPKIQNVLGKTLENPPIYKIGVFTGYVQSRVNAILNNIDDLATVRVVRTFNIQDTIYYYGVPVRENYIVELNAHQYLKAKNIKFAELDGYNYIPSLKAIANMSGKTEWFICSEKQAISAVLNGIRYSRSHPQKMMDNQFINFRGCITKYGRKASTPSYELQKSKKFVANGFCIDNPQKSKRFLND